MLVVGLAAGLLLRPLLTPTGGRTTAEGGEPDPGAAGPVAPAATVTLTGPLAAAEATQRAAQGQALMAQVVANTRHFKGDPAAPVTLIEFSDFQ
jgi:hypothetical protein